MSSIDRPRFALPRHPLTVVATLLAMIGLVAPPAGAAHGLAAATPGPGTAATPQAPADWPTPGQLEALTYRFIGPVGNRVSAVVGVPGDPNVYYAGAASGGVFKTTDGGATWEPVFDDQPVAAIGSIAIDPQNPDVVWVGTGETFIRSNILTGDGIYRSVDGGKTWEHMGLEDSGRIGRIVVDPLDPDRVFAAAMGHSYGPQEQRGVFRTTDGGTTWERVLHTDEDTGASDVVMAPGNPNVLFAGMWPLFIRTWGRTSGGPGGGLFMSRDGGDTWVELSERNGLPRKPYGKIGLGMSSDDPDRVYALIEVSSNGLVAPLREEEGTLYRSDDLGATWRMVNAEHHLMQRPLYYTRLAVAPDDANEVHFMSTRHSISYDGGETTEGGNAGFDHHDMWIDPEIPDRMIVGHDGGVSISTNGGRSWARPTLPVAQMYHVYTDDRVPYFVMGNRQDGPSIRGPSNSLTGGEIAIGEWRTVGGCESGFAVPAGEEHEIVWSGCYDGILEVHDLETGHSRNVSPWPDNPEGWAAAPLEYRFQWTFPIHVSPHDDETVYVGSQVVHRTTDRGVTWETISPDLSTDDESLQQKTGGLTYDDTSPTYAAVLFAIAESPVEQGVIWAGTNDGLLHVTRDGGDNWIRVSDAMPDLPELSTISRVEPSRHVAGAAYVAVDTHQLGIFDPFLYKTEDYGQSWERIDGWSGEAAGPGAIPAGPLSYTHAVQEDPQRPGLLYAGTANAVYVSFDDGDRWIELQSDLPHAPVHWLTVQEHFNDLVVGTYGRGFWIMDDVTPLQQMSDEILASDAHLFEPRPAYRFQRVGTPNSGQDAAAGENPEYGASLTYWLRPDEEVGDEGAGEPDPEDTTAAMPRGAGQAVPGSTGELDTRMEEEPEEPWRRVRIEILDAGGDVVRTLRNVPARPGLNRTWWDLDYEASDRAVLRTKPIGHPHVELGDDGTRPAGDGGPVVLLAPPGEYTVRLTVDGETQSRSLAVLKDPNSAGTAASIDEQFRMLLQLRDDQQAVVAMIDRAERVRRQLYDLRDLVRGRDRADEVDSMVDGIDDAIIDVEMQLTDLRLVGGQDTLRWPRQLYAKIASLAGYVSGHDFAPTRAHRTVHEKYRESLGTHQEELRRILEVQVAELNRLLEEMGVETIVVEAPGVS